MPIKGESYIMNDKIVEEIEKFINDRVWITKKVRMEAEARMNFYNSFTQYLLIYYTFAVLAFSILTLVIDDNNISLMTVIASVGLFGISIFVSAIGYREKAIQYKISYIRLNELEFNLKGLIRENNTEESYVLNKLNFYENKYNEILDFSENHHEKDFIKVSLRGKKKISFLQKSKYFSLKIVNILLYLVLVLAPIIMCMFLFKGLVISDWN